jgi:hypothetical protein
MDTNIIGANAGIVWRSLEKDKRSWEELIKSTGLNPLELASTIGGLARENKIHSDFNNGIMYFSVQPIWYF